MNGVFPKSDEHINAKMMDGIGYFYIKVHSLEPDTLHRTANGDVVDWESNRGWFDELVPIYRRRAIDLERVWTDPQGDQNDARSLSDSYFECDLSEWRNVQLEREQSLSLGFENYSCLDAQLPVISAIE
jgi:casein kinase I family protein HRR25